VSNHYELQACKFTLSLKHMFGILSQAAMIEVADMIVVGTATEVVEDMVTGAAAMIVVREAMVTEAVAMGTAVVDTGEAADMAAEVMMMATLVVEEEAMVDIVAVEDINLSM
jgi:hypothetical protein